MIDSSSPTPPFGERRRNRVLREQLDELLGLVRRLARQAATMPPAELKRSQERLEWLADEVWRTITLGSDDLGSP
ncbi:MAG: hypothetical protein NVS4B3_04070 [Gemmatimonadaceae bacterium]